MATTPLIKTPQADGGTFYTLSSSARDLSKTLNNDNLKLVFSKFVLLNIPDFDKLDPNTFSNYENYMQFDTIDGMIASGGLKGDPNVNFTESLQNYALNLEELIISDSSYDNTIQRSVAERVFFKWMKETGAIRFRAATNLEKNPGVTRPLFVEEDEQTRVPTHRVNPSIEQEQCQRLAALRSKRDNQIVNQLRDRLTSAAQSDDNLMPLLITCVENDMTLGEICNTLRNVWGEYRPEQSI